MITEIGGHARRLDGPKTPYDRGYADGQDHCWNDPYYGTLSNNDQSEYDLGFYDGDGGYLHRDQQQQEGA